MAGGAVPWGPEYERLKGIIGEIREERRKVSAEGYPSVSMIESPSYVAIITNRGAGLVREDEPHKHIWKMMRTH